MKTVSRLPFNLSQKALLAFLFPLIAAATGAAVDWIVSGQFEVTAIRTAVAGLLASGLALLGAYVGKPADVIYPVHEVADLHDVAH